MTALTADGLGVHVPCAACGQTNRLRWGQVERPTRCGRCQSALEAPSGPIAVPDASIFDAMVRDASLPIAVDFWAPWCGPCRAMAPELDRVALQTRGRWLIAKVDTDRVPDLGERFRIRSIPTLAVFRGGREVARTAGAMPAADIERFLSGAPSPGST